MTTEKIKRSQVRTFIDVDPPYADWALLGEGVTNAAIEYNPEVTQETYIHEDNASAEVERYAPTMGIEATAVKGDEVFDYVDQLRIDRAVLDAAHTQLVNVWMYKTAEGSAYPAELQDIAIAVESKGGEGGESSKINFTIYYRGDPTKGTFNPTTLTFTPAA